ncbi:hypothetical protein PYV61_01250, partial [Roseisolibacter sp. H3M3-2]
MSGRPRYLRPGWLILGALLLGWGGWAAWPRVRAAFDRRPPGAAPAVTAEGPEFPAPGDSLAAP